MISPWSFNMAPKNQTLEKEIPIKKQSFSGSMLNFGSVSILQPPQKKTPTWSWPPNGFGINHHLDPLICLNDLPGDNCVQEFPSQLGKSWGSHQIWNAGDFLLQDLS